MSSSATPNPEAVPNIRKAAMLLVALGEDASAAVCRTLPSLDLQRLASEIAELGPVPAAGALEVIEEYLRLWEERSGFSPGGRDYVTRLLNKAVGAEETSRLIHIMDQATEASAGQLEALNRTEPKLLSSYLQEEHPQTIALVLAHLEAKHASQVLMNMPEDMRPVVVKRLAQLRPFTPEVALQVARVLQQRVQAVCEQTRRGYQGVRGVADMLNCLEPAAGKLILETIERDDAQVALSIRNLMFTFEDLLSVNVTGIRELLSGVDKKSLALALRGSSEDLRNYIFKAMSSRAVDMLKEDMEVLGPVRAKDVQAAQREVVASARRLEEQGKITLMQESNDEFIV